MHLISKNKIKYSHLNLEVCEFTLDWSFFFFLDRWDPLSNRIKGLSCNNFSSIQESKGSSLISPKLSYLYCLPILQEDKTKKSTPSAEALVVSTMKGIFMLWWHWNLKHSSYLKAVYMQNDLF